MLKLTYSFLLMYVAFFVYSFASVFSKLASAQPFLSATYFCCLFAMLTIMALYAVVWQIVLKRIPLSIAISNKPIALICSLFWAVFFFNEKLTIKMIIGILFIFVGIVIIGFDSRTVEEK